VEAIKATEKYNMHTHLNSTALLRGHNSVLLRIWSCTNYQSLRIYGKPAKSNGIHDDRKVHEIMYTHSRSSGSISWFSSFVVHIQT